MNKIKVNNEIFEAMEDIKSKKIYKFGNDKEKILIKKINKSFLDKRKILNDIDLKEFIEILFYGYYKED